MEYPYQIQSYEQYLEAYRAASDNPEAFWAGVAEHFRWKRKWDSV
ncbi:MAG: acetyl-coenzyme A synthetase N-terminal domain-containing protein, partial [Schleiferiaceae bacterium]